MFAKFRRLVQNNVFGIALWSAIGALLLISSQRPASHQALGASTGGGGGSPGEQFCQLVAEIDDFFCGEDGPIAMAQISYIRFEPNVGQAGAGYLFVAHGRGQSILLTETEAVFQLKGSKTMKPREVHALLEGARSGGGSRAEAPLSGRVNYLLGPDPKGWHTDIPTFAQVRFPEVYPHIDVVYHGAAGELENDFVVQPGGDPESIRIRLGGADSAVIQADGSLAIGADQRSLIWQKPLFYQSGPHGTRNRVEGRFKMTADGAIGFEVGVYDTRKPLVIDPPLTYATYFGSPDTEAAGRVVADNNGNAYIVGGTDDQGFPSTPGTYVTSKSGLQGNVMVAKLSADGKTMIYETHIGGSNGDIGYGIALDGSGDVYLTGMTASADFPIQPAANNLTTKSVTDPMNCFVLELNSGGNALVYSTLLGGSQVDGCSSVGVDSAGNTYVGGVTDSTDLPTTTNAIQSTAPGALFGNPSWAAFMAKLAPGGSNLQYCTYYGGPGNTAATSLALDSSGNTYFTGFTTSSSFSTTSGALQTTFGGSGGQTNSTFTTGDAFVLKLTASGQRVYATFLGGAKDDIGVGIAVDSSGDAYVGGATLSGNFPTMNAFQSSYAGAGGSPYAAGGDGFIAELNPSGSALLFSSYIGGTEDDRVLGVALDSSGNIYLAGHTISSNFPTAGQQAQSGYAGDNSGIFKTGDAFLAEVSASHTLTFSTYLGGSGGDWAGGVAVDGQGGIIIAGGTSSTNFPATTGAYQTQFAGLDSYMAGVPFGDAFIARFGGSATSAVSLSGISNAASYAGGAIAPGEAVLIAGSGIGPATLAGAQCTTSACTSLATKVSNTQFTFNGTAAPIVYVSSQYSSVIVPYELAGSSTAQVVATVNGVSSPPMTVKVVPALPGIFSANSSGTGQGAIFNQDLSHNSAQNPAAPGTTVVLFLTGEGQTVPAGVDGQVTEAQISPVAQPVTVLFGGVPATSYAFVGEAPGEVAGLLQINVTIPTLAPTGSSVPVVVNVGTYSTQNGITVAIQ